MLCHYTSSFPRAAPIGQSSSALPVRKVLCMKQSWHEKFMHGNKFMHDNFISMHKNEISMHGNDNDIFLQENEITTHENDIKRFGTKFSFLCHKFIRHENFRAYAFRQVAVSLHYQVYMVRNQIEACEKGESDLWLVLPCVRISNPATDYVRSDLG